MFDYRLISNYAGAVASSGPGLHIKDRHLWTDDHSVAETENTTLNKRRNSMTPAVFEPTIPLNELPQTHGLDLAASGIGISRSLNDINSC